MGWWVPKPLLMRDETVRWTVGAIREQPVNRHPGGRLFVTCARLLFEPNRVDALAGGRQWSMRLGNIRGFDVVAAGTTVLRPWDVVGGLRRRLRLAGIDGAVEMFVVNHVDAVAGRLNAVLSEETDTDAGA